MEPWRSDHVNAQFDKLLRAIFGSEAIHSFRLNHYKTMTEIWDNFNTQKESFFEDPLAKFHKVALPMNFMFNMLEYISKDGKDHDFEDIINKATPFGLPAGQHLKFKDDELSISSTIWREYMFDKAINPMIDHTQKLIDRANNIKDAYDEPKQLSYLCISGGLAANKYFQHRINEAFGPQSNYKMSIRIPREPALAVVNGALMTIINEVRVII